MRRSERRAAVVGVLAAGTTVAVAHLAAALVAPGSSPVLAVAATVVDAVPAWLKDLAIAWFGTADKAALLVGTGLVLAAAGAGLGLLTRRRPRTAGLLVAALAVLGAVAAASRPDAGPLAPAPSLVGGAVGVLVLRSLVARWCSEPVPAAEDGSTSPDRRAFLLATGVVGALAVIAAVTGTVVDAGRRGVSAARAALRLPAPARPAAPLPAGVEVGVPGVVPFETPAAEFYRIDTALTVPRVDPATWRLRVHGRVAEEVELTLDDLLSADLVEAWVTLACVSNPVGGDLIGNARWLGLPVREVLARARPLEGADMVLSTSADGFTASTPLSALTDGRDALLAVGMNGEPLPEAHGFPVRLVVPGLYGYVSATKWLVDLEVTTFAERSAYWTVRGWAERGPVKVSSRVEVPRAGARVDAGRVVVAGTAWAQHVGVTGVEVQVDDGPWQDATLAAEASVDTWRQWTWTWDDAAAGRHVLRCRARTPDEVQTGEEAPPAPDGATGWHEIEIEVQAAS